jgi:hypothetical protein
MPIHGTYTVNDKKEHDNLHLLFEQGVLHSCWCNCRRCWNSQRVMGTCYQDPNNSQYLSQTFSVRPVPARV